MKAVSKAMLSQFAAVVLMQQALIEIYAACLTGDVLAIPDVALEALKATGLDMATIKRHAVTAVANRVEDADLPALRRQYADMCDRAQTAEDKAARLEAAIRAFLKLQVGLTRDALYRAIGEEPPVRRVVDVYGEEAAAKGGAV